MPWLVLLVLSAPRDVYYSAGQNTLDHKTDSTGSLRVVLSGGVATFSEPQLAPNLGVGDVVEYDVNGQRAYLVRKIDSSTWTVTTNTGDVPPDTAPVTVNAIHHAFASVYDALRNGQAAALLGTSDLADAGVALHVACYFDTGPETISTDALYVVGFSTSPQTYVHLFTPAQDCNMRQRHAGVWDDTKFSLVAGGIYNLLDVEVIDARIEGMQLKVAPPDGTTFIDAIDLRHSGRYDIFDNLIQGVFGGTSGSNRGIELEGTSNGPDLGDAGVTRIWNNIIWGFVNGTINMHAVEHDYGATDILLMFNNTLVHNDNAFIASNVGVSVLNNNLFQDNLAFVTLGLIDGCNNVFGPAVEPNATTCATMNGVTVAFVDAGDFHLAGPLDAGLNLGAPYDVDIDGDPRPASGPWDIGADQFVARAADAGRDAGAPDAGTPDAGDAGFEAHDGGPVPDGGTEQNLRAECGCSSSPGLLLISALAAAARRRACRAPGGPTRPSAG
jgi:hypothetical protein